MSNLEEAGELKGIAIETLSLMKEIMGKIINETEYFRTQLDELRPRTDLAIITGEVVSIRGENITLESDNHYRFWLKAPPRKIKDWGIKERTCLKVWATPESEFNRGCRIDVTYFVVKDVNIFY